MTQLGGPLWSCILLIESWPGKLFIGPGQDNDDPRLHEYLLDTFFRHGSTPTDHPVIRYYISRVVNYTHIESMADALIYKARTVTEFDIHTPASCLTHAGKIVNVVDAALRIGWMRTLSMSEYGRYAYGADFGFPPFSVECRCRMEGIIPGVDR